ncbi:winged helix-turn-helix transcriptional regulator [Streptomyces sp. DT203]|uniref:winged helix-turn-helix transcriptional regulator n=1 Tax=Streptomyces sp. DT203 TaxID=3393424 RepID=UPI003CED8873
MNLPVGAGVDAAAGGPVCWVPCSVARTMDLLGDWWTPVLREAFYGIRRFDAFQESLGIARNTLNDRLRRLVDEGRASAGTVEVDARA